MQRELQGTSWTRRLMSCWRVKLQRPVQLLMRLSGLSSNMGWMIQEHESLLPAPKCVRVRQPVPVQPSPIRSMARWDTHTNTLCSITPADCGPGVMTSGQKACGLYNWVIRSRQPATSHSGLYCRISKKLYRSLSKTSVLPRSGRDHKYTKRCHLLAPPNGFPVRRGCQSPISCTLFSSVPNLSV